MFRTASRVLLSALLVLSFMAITVGLGTDRAAASSPVDEQQFVDMINDLRAKKGLPALAVHPELTSGARSWTAHMAGTAKLAHSPDMSDGLTADWTVLGENVGIHGVQDLDQLFQAFVDSPAHYQNLIDPRFNYVGVGVVVSSEGKLWTTHRFMAAPEPEPQPTTQTTTPQKTAPPTTAPTKTTPPTTAPPKTKPAKTVPADSTPPTTAKPQPPADPATPPTAPTDTTTPTTTVQTTTVQPTAEAPTSSTPATDGADQEIVDMVVNDDPTAGPTAPDVPTVEQVLVELAEAGI